MTKNAQSSFTLLYAVLVVGALMSLVFVTLNIVYKQEQLSLVSKFSQVAFYAADSGVECAHYWNDFGAFGLAPLAGNTITGIDCQGQTIAPPAGSCMLSTGTSNSNGAACSIASINSPAAVTCPSSGDSCYPSTFNYSPAAGYTNLTPDVNVYVYQDKTVNTNNTSTTTIITTGHNTKNVLDPARVERGIETTLAPTQCLASAFPYTPDSPSADGIISSGTSLPITLANGLGSLISPFWPGLAISTIDTQPAGGFLCNFLFQRGSGCGSNYYPYLLFPPAYWQVTTTQPISVAAAFLASPIPSNSDPANPDYVFGYYTDQGGGPDPTDTFVPLVDWATTPTGFGTPITINATIPTGQNIYFGLEVLDADNGNAEAAFWSTNTDDDASNVNSPDGNIHVMTFATPSPITSSGIIATGKYIFGFDTNTALGNTSSAVLFNNVVVTLQIAGCP